MSEDKNNKTDAKEAVNNNGNAENMGKIDGNIAYVSEGLTFNDSTSDIDNKQTIAKKSNNIEMTNFLWLGILTLGLLWGSSFYFTKISLNYGLTPIDTIYVRILLGGLFLYFFQYFRKKPINQILKANYKTFLLLGLIANALPFALIAWGQQYISTSLASITNALTPISAFIIAHYFMDDEKLNLRKAIGVMLGFTAIVILFGVESFDGIGANFFAQLALVGATICYGFAIMLAKKTKIDNPVSAATGQLIFASIILTPVMIGLHLFGYGSDLQLFAEWNVIYALISLGFFNTALAYFVYFYLIPRAGAGNVSLVTFIVPVFTMILGSFGLNEIIKLHYIIALVILFTGFLIIDGRIIKWLFKMISNK